MAGLMEAQKVPNQSSEERDERELLTLEAILMHSVLMMVSLWHHQGNKTIRAFIAAALLLAAWLLDVSECHS
jgi:hypothetical protein